MSLLRLFGVSVTILIITLTTFVPDGDPVFFLLAALLLMVSFSIGWADEDDAEYWILSICLLLTGVIGIQLLGEDESVLAVTRMSSAMTVCGIDMFIGSIAGDLLRGFYLSRKEKKALEQEPED